MSKTLTFSGHVHRAESGGGWFIESRPAGHVMTTYGIAMQDFVADQLRAANAAELPFSIRVHIGDPEEAPDDSPGD